MKVFEEFENKHLTNKIISEHMCFN